MLEELDHEMDTVGGKLRMVTKKMNLILDAKGKPCTQVFSSSSLTIPQIR
jgi:hypothetical protein